jgi:hypothetical protein
MSEKITRKGLVEQVGDLTTPFYLVVSGPSRGFESTAAAMLHAMNFHVPEDKTYIVEVKLVVDSVIHDEIVVRSPKYKDFL